jgi:Fic family protein
MVNRWKLEKEWNETFKDKNRARREIKKLLEHNFLERIKIRNQQ